MGKPEPIHAAEPPCIGGKPLPPRKSPPVCNRTRALVQSRTYRLEMVTCCACRRRVADRPQLLAAMRSALQLELPLE